MKRVFGFGEISSTTLAVSRPNPLEDEVTSLFEQLRIPVLRYLISRSVPVPDAEEIVQEVFLLLFRNLQIGKAADNPAGWVFRAAHNFVLRHHDRVRVQSERFAGAGTEAEAAADTAIGADTALEATQRQNQLMAVVRALPEQDQQCLHLRAEGLKYRQIAEVLDVSLGTVCNSLQRSLARIARADNR